MKWVLVALSTSCSLFLHSKKRHALSQHWTWFMAVVEIKDVFWAFLCLCKKLQHHLHRLEQWEHAIRIMLHISFIHFLYPLIHSFSIPASGETNNRVCSHLSYSYNVQPHIYHSIWKYTVLFLLGPVTLPYLGSVSQSRFNKLWV